MLQPSKSTPPRRSKESWDRAWSRAIFLSAALLVSGCASWWTLPPESGEGAATEASGGAPPESAPVPEEPLTYQDPGVWDRMFADAPGTPEVDVTDERTRQILHERGRYLVRGPAACGSCHGAKPGDPSATLVGGQLFQDRFGPVRAANITPDSATGIGGWTINDIVRALRASLKPDGQPLSIDLHSGYRWMSDADAKAIAVYISTLPAVSSTVERRELGSFERKRWGIFSQHRQVEGYIPAPPKSKSTAYGRYLSYHVAGCYGCHTPEGGIVSSAAAFSGSETGSRGLVSSFTALFSLLLPRAAEHDAQEEDTSVQSLLSDDAKREYFGTEPDPTKSIQAAPESVQGGSGLDASFNEAVENGLRPVGGPDIRGTSENGLASWSKEDLARYLSNGTGPDNRVRDPRVCPWPWFQRMADSDKDALAGFIKQQ